MFPNTDRMSLWILFLWTCLWVTKSSYRVWSFPLACFSGFCYDPCSRCQATHPHSWDWNRRPQRLTRSSNTSSSRSSCWRRKPVSGCMRHACVLIMGQWPMRMSERMKSRKRNLLIINFRMQVLRNIIFAFIEVSNIYTIWARTIFIY